MNDDSELNDFARTLKTLTTNDKYIINTLSVMAMNARNNENLSREISKVAMSNIFKVSPALKLCSFYVVDSIIKNVGSPYKEMFSDKVLDAFIHTFQSNKDHKIRIKLYNLRLTWKDYFPSVLMNKLDEEVKKCDPAWPLVQKFNPKAKNGEKKPETTNESSSAKSSPDSTTPAVNRDPRIFKIVKPEKEIDRKRPIKDNEDLFTIDREGEEHIDKLINKKPRVESKEYGESGLFGSKDLDLRVKSDDCDMRAASESKQHWTSKDVFEMLIKHEKLPTTFVEPSAGVKITSDRPVPQPRDPIWKIKIDGFPQMPQIGTDPRLLSRCPFYDGMRTITIDGTKYNLYLDRIQPCIVVNGNLHAVRFYCQNMELYIDNVPFQVSADGLAHIKINRRFYIACLGGPGHELIINGWPYNVRIDGNMYKITVGGYPVSVQFVVQRPMQVNVHRVIPPFVSDWAIKGFFGSPQYLNIPPLNPLRNQKLQDSTAFQFRNELAGVFDRRAAFPSQPDSVPPAIVAPPVDVHDLFQKLVASGIILPNAVKAAAPPTNEVQLDFTKYSADTFKAFNDREITELYSGHQCDLCGTRFKNKDSKQFELHLDYHFYKNTTSLTSTRKGRNYVAGSRQWVLGGSVRPVDAEFSFEQTADCEQKFKCPMFEDADMNKCAVCMEGFEIAWDDDEEAFMLQDGQLHNNKVYHPICLEDADKQNQDQPISDTDKSQIELTNQPLAALQKVLQGKMDSVVLPESVQCESDFKSNQSDQDFDYESAIS